MQAMPTIQLLLDLDYSLCNAMMLPFKFKPSVRSFGLAPVQLKLNFKKQIEKVKPNMNKLIVTCFCLTLFSLGMFFGALMSDYEWYRMLTDKSFECSVLDSSKICKAKIDLQQAAQNLNDISVTSDGGSNDL